MNRIGINVLYCLRGQLKARLSISQGDSAMYEEISDRMEEGYQRGYYDGKHEAENAFGAYLERLISNLSREIEELENA